CGIKVDGTLYCWGASSNGECGPNATGAMQPTPVMVTTAITAVAVTNVATCAAASDGKLYCFGANTFGELGELNPIGMATPTPALATNVTGWSALASAEDYLCGLAGSDVWCWGTASGGGLGHGLWYDGPSVAPPAFNKVVSG